ncbi:1-phosphatidylinositol 4,5-bisphosphate phosphodiesterase delta-1 isoform X1 [Arapaima gigas]
MPRIRSNEDASANGEMTRLDGDADVRCLRNGGHLLKVRSNTWKKYRFYKLLEDYSTIFQETHKIGGRRKTFSLDEIEMVRQGRNSEGLKKYTDENLEDQCFSIIFKNHHKTLDLIANSREEATHWTAGLEKVIRIKHNFSQQQSREHWIFTCMRKVDKNNDNMMTLKEIKHFLRQMNIEMSDKYAEMLFKKCDTSKSETLEGSEIIQFYNLLTNREEINEIYSTYAQTGGEMSGEDLLKFLVHEQREKVSLNDALRLIEKYELDETAKRNRHMTKDGFLMYLQQAEGMLFNPAHKDLYQDMSQPLSHYFISSSHNTYLMEDQLKGPSSTEAYIRALMKSCRCVELDCWDGPNGDPTIYHGYTLTSKVPFKEVIRAIRDYSFKTSQYPVIISLENHCSLQQQKLMAHYMTSILGNALVVEPLEDEMPTHFPSPQELMGRFLVKGKRLNKLDSFFNPGSALEVDSVSEEDEAAEVKTTEEKPKAKSSKMKLARELSDLVVYCKSVHFSSFEHARDKQAFYEMSSFKESKALNLAKTSANAFIHHNTDRLSRIYPAGSRTDSSNYSPVPLWNAGCQIVALNFQTPSKEMDLNQGRFLPNGFSGYVLKPEFLRNPKTQFDPNNLTQGPWIQRKKFHVMIISAQQLPKVNQEKQNSIVDPLVRVEIYGVPEDNAEKHTHHINNNGFNPMWNENFEFNIFVPELALVRFMVEDYDTASQNDFVGQYTLPFTSIQNGYRHIPLCNKRGHIIPSASLFVHVMILDR